jgi:hypothetical protein
MSVTTIGSGISAGYADSAVWDAPRIAPQIASAQSAEINKRELEGVDIGLRILDDLGTEKVNRKRVRTISERTMKERRCARGRPKKELVENSS